MNGGGGTSSEEAGPSASQLEAQPSSPKSPSGRGFKSLKRPSRQRTSASGRSNEVSEGSLDGDGAERATIFNTRDRPNMYPTESYAVGGGKQKQDQHSSSFDSRLWKNLGPRIPSLPSMPEMPNVPLLTKKEDRPARTGSSSKRRSQSGDRAGRDEQQATEQTAEGGTGKALPLKQKLSDLHAKHPNLKDMSKPLLPIAVFPNQGTGKSSEFNQDAPIWARQPYKLLYFVYFGLTVGLIFLPWFAISSLFQSQRPRKTWSWKRSTLVKLYRHGTRLTFRTHTSLSRDITKEVPHSKTVRAKFVWVDGLADELVRGGLRSAMLLQNVTPSRTCGFWYGERDGGGGVGQQATANEKVVYHLHGGAYWIGTAHEKDVTSAVNMQVLRALNSIYSSRLPLDESQHFDIIPQPSPHPPTGGPIHPSRRGAQSGGLCKRSFSLDYRLCVPGKPELGSYPAALLDALAGYRYLVKECGFEAKNVIVAGDSAGGNLALALCRYLRSERIEEMPGAMLLLSPWADTSRSHSGPTESPNKFSTSYLNGACDIISPSLAFRNTAVSALLGKMAARETYRNPYFSSISLQLPAEKGGSGPSWGFEGFPRRVYICTGSAELSYDQHLTLAYRLAGGTKNRKPIHRGDMLSVNEDAYEMAARLSYPRPKDHEVTLWPSAQNTPAGTPLMPPPGWAQSNKTTSVNGPSLSSSGDGSTSVGEDEEQGRRKLGSRMKSANGYSLPNARAKEDTLGAHGQMGRVGSSNSLQHPSLVPSTTEAAKHNGHQAGEGPNTNAIKEKDTLAGASITHQRDQQVVQEEKGQEAGFIGGERETAESRTTASRQSKQAEFQSSMAMPMAEIKEKRQSKSLEEHAKEESYFDVGGEDRTVVLDECRDAIHDYTLFDWYEPERGQTWARIAEWIDEEV